MNSSELKRRAEISYRQLDYWTRRGYLRPLGEDDLTARLPGSGTSRVWSDGMMQKARLMGCLVKLGFEVSLAERIAQHVSIEGNKSIYLGHGVTVRIEPHTH